MPCSIMCPWFITRITSAVWTVDNSWATTKLVRPYINVSKARWMRISVMVSMEDVASSRISMGAGTA